MARPRPASELAILQESWQQWTSVVESFATKRWHRSHVDQGDYRRVHSRLLQACRSLAEQADPEQRSFYASLEELARPWLSPRILGRTDDRFLADLLLLCRQAEMKLTGREQRRPSRRWLVSVAVFGSAGAALALLVLALPARGWPVVGWIGDFANAIYRAAAATTLVQRLVVSGMILAAVAIGVVARTRRS